MSDQPSKKVFEAPSLEEEDTFYAAVRDGHNKVVGRYIDKYGPTAAHNGRLGKMPVFYIAAVYGHKDTVLLLRKKGADIDRQVGSGGETVLMWLACNNYGDAVKLMLECGADIHAKNKKGATVMDMCQSGWQDQSDEVLRQWHKMLERREQQKLDAQKERDLEEITKTVMGGLTRNLPVRRPFKF